MKAKLAKFLADLWNEGVGDPADPEWQTPQQALQECGLADAEMPEGEWEFVRSTECWSIDTDDPDIAPVHDFVERPGVTGVWVHNGWLVVQTANSDHDGNFIPNFFFARPAP